MVSRQIVNFECAWNLWVSTDVKSRKSEPPYVGCCKCSGKEKPAGVVTTVAALPRLP
jgi:hypothetical protein